MRYRGSIVLCVLMMCSLVAAGKKKVILPTYVLEAKTVVVVVDPDAGLDADAPNANRKAQQDVENALVGWGRFSLANDIATADLVIVVRKGSGRLVQPTVGGIPQNRPGVFDPAGPAGGVGPGPGDRRSPQFGDPASSQQQGPHPQMEVGATQDTFAVYEGKRTDALRSSPAWRYSRSDALASPSVPAVEAFRKTIAEAEKQQATKP
jgi:hypothetical protein